MRPIVWGLVLMVVGGLFWTMFSVIYGIISGFGGEESVQGRFLVSTFGILFFFSLPCAVLLEFVSWLTHRGERQDITKVEVETRTKFEKKYCAHCGAEMFRNGIFCPNCGRKQPYKF